MADAAAVVLAHDNPAHVRRLLRAIDALDIVLHCDARTPANVFAEMLRDAPEGIAICRRRATKLSSWSLMDAELIGLRAALEHSTAQHVIIMSGSCYPLVSTGELLGELAFWRGWSRMTLKPIPYPPWGTPRNPDGGMWRFNRRFLTFRDQVVRVRGVPVRTVRQRIPSPLRLRASLGWKIYAREHADALLRTLDEHPELVRFWRRTLIPSESCVASILSSHELVGDVADVVVDDLPWYMDWGWTPDMAAPTAHPRWLDMSDLEALTAARRAPVRMPGDGGPDDAYRKLFARKLRPADSALADAIDEQLRT